MRPIRAKETGAPVAYCVRQGKATQRRFDEAIDRAASEFHATTVDQAGGWVRCKSKLAWPRTTHPSVPRSVPKDKANLMPTTEVDPETNTTVGPKQQLVKRITKRTEYAHLQAEISEKRAEEIIESHLGGEVTPEEAREIEAILSTDVGEKLASLVEGLAMMAAGEATRV